MDETFGIFVVSKKVCVTELKPGDIILDISSKMFKFDYDFINRIFSKQTYNNKVRNNDGSATKVIIKDKEIVFAILGTVYSISIINDEAKVIIAEGGYDINCTIGDIISVLEYVPFSKLKQEINANILLNLINFI